MGGRRGGRGGAGSRGIPPLCGGRWGHVGGSAGPASRPEPGRTGWEMARRGQAVPSRRALGPPPLPAGSLLPRPEGQVHLRGRRPGLPSLAPLPPRKGAAQEQAGPRGTLPASPGPRTSPRTRGEAAHVPGAVRAQRSRAQPRIQGNGKDFQCQEPAPRRGHRPPPLRPAPTHRAPKSWRSWGDPALRASWGAELSCGQGRRTALRSRALRAGDPARGGAGLSGGCGAQPRHRP